MIACPDCGYDNIPGADVCEQCSQSLSGLSEPTPHSAIERHIEEDLIEVLNPKTPTMVSPETTVAEVLRILVDQKIGSVLVVENETVTGIFSERDALFRLNIDAAKYSSRPIAEFMTPDPQTLKADDKIAFALHRMDLGGYRHIPILTDGKPTGIISVRDILRYMSERLVAEEN